MLKKMLVVSVATAGLACGAAFAGGPTNSPMAMSGPWGVTVGFGVNFTGASDFNRNGTLASTPVFGLVSYVDFADMFRVDAGLGVNTANGAGANSGSTSTTARPVSYNFQLDVNRLMSWGSQSWFTYGLGAGYTFTGRDDKGNNSQNLFNISADVGFQRALTAHSLVWATVPVATYSFAGNNADTTAADNSSSAVSFFSGFNLHYTYLF